jgi:hypothetical protein
LELQGGGAPSLCRCMSDFHDDSPDAPAAAVSAALTEQMLHLLNRYHEERRKLEQRTFRAYDDEDRD